MVETMGICEKHELPLDRNGECELCRLGEMPSKSPPSPSAWWAVIIPVVILLTGVVWAFASFGSEPEGVPQRGVRTTTPRQAAPPPTPNEPPAPEPEEIPEPPTPPPVDDIPIPKPSEEGTKLDAPSDPDVPEWKRDLARRRVAVTMYATQWCGVCRKARQYMEANRIEFIELDTDESSTARERLGKLNPRKTVPTFEIDELVYVGFREELFEAKLDQAAQKHL